MSWRAWSPRRRRVVRLVRALRVLAFIAFTGCASSTAPAHTTTVAPAPHDGLIHGWASWYGQEQQGGPTASGERFDMHQLTAAHRSLPLGSIVRVTNTRNGRTVDVRINDRGPYGPRRERIIDLSQAAAARLGFLDAGTAPITLEVIRAGHGH